MARGRQAFRFNAQATWDAREFVERPAGILLRHDRRLAPEDRSINVFVDNDGFLRVRPGFSSLGFGLFAVLGAETVTDTNRSRVYFVTDSGILVYDGSGPPAFVVDPSGPTAPQLPAKIRHFGYSGAAVRMVYLVTQRSLGLRVFIDNASQSIVPVSTPELGSVAAQDMDVVADRVVVVNTLEAGGIFPNRIRWSKILDPESFDPLSYIDVQGIGDIVAIRARSFSDAIVYGRNGFGILRAIPGGDVDAFAFSVLSTTYVPPHVSAQVARVGNDHFYIGEDMNLYSADVQGVTQLSFGVRNELQDIVGSPGQFVLASYDPVDEAVYAVFHRRDDGSSLCVRYDIQRKLVSPPWLLGRVVTSMVPNIIAGSDPWSTDMDPWAPGPSSPWLPSSASGAVRRAGFLASLSLPGEICELFGSSPLDGTATIPWVTTWNFVGPDDPRLRFVADTVELEGVRTPIPVTIAAEVYARERLHGLSRLTVYKGDFESSEPRGWARQITPVLPTSSSGTSMLAANYIQLTIRGQSPSVPLLASAAILGNSQDRTDMDIGVETFWT